VHSLTFHPAPPEGVRRSLRHRYKPLDWWRLEKVIYDNKSDGLVLVPHIKEIVRIPKEPTESLGKHKRKRGTSRAKSESVKVTHEELVPQGVFNPEEGWDDKTEPHGIVIDFVSKQEVERREFLFLCQT
jgi:centromere protein C